MEKRLPSYQSTQIQDVWMSYQASAVGLLLEMTVASSIMPTSYQNFNSSLHNHVITCAPND